ncbi:MAG TPA: LPS assembly protein LptD [Steroidobacteraceae bacterium]|nr:LPS assembly protein LptD [Steroidobacteraceae bacterium]
MQPPASRSLDRAPLGLLLSVLLLAAAAAQADPTCPAPPSLTLPRVSSLPAVTTAPVEVTTAGAEVTDSGDATLKGPVAVRQGDRTLSSHDATYEAETATFDAAGSVEYRDPRLHLSGDAATWHTGGGGSFNNAEFELPARQARGHAASIEFDSDGHLKLTDVDYTACPVGHRDWFLKAQSIDIDQKAGLGVGRDVELNFKGVPLFYLPVVSFPTSDARKSGFLFPTIGESSNNGFELAVPYYWNLAPNYDATLTPGYMSKRGATFGTEFRFLTSDSRGQFQSDWVPYDASADRDRSFIRFTEQTDFTSRLRFDTNIAYASDSAYFEDFGVGSESTSVIYLTRAARLTYLDSHWQATGLVEQWQTIDETVAATDRPYTRAPQITIRGQFGEGVGPGFDVRGEAVNFTRDTGIQGARYDLEPTASWAFREPGAFFVSSLGWRATRYALRDDPGVDDSPAFSAPIAAIDSGLTFERIDGSRLETFEPRALYTYIPYRDQSTVPIFDTGLPDFNLIQLFRSERYVGGDRLGDANQLAVGATSRLVDAASGSQFLAATLGEIYYFTPPRVTLPNEPAVVGDTSDVVAQLDVAAYKHWNIDLGEQWDPHAGHADVSELQLQYRPANDRVVNVGYRFRRDLLEQLDTSAAWPVADSWNLYARYVYSLRDRTATDAFAGFEYRSCCWALRLVFRHYVSTFTGTRDTSLSLQLELNGLSSVGQKTGAFLEQSIRGYSATPPQTGLE